MSEIKQLDWEKAVSEGIIGKSGKVYKFDGGLSIRKFAKAKEYECTLGFGVTLTEFLDEQKKVWNLFNEGKSADGIYALGEMMRRTNDLASRYYPQLMLCSCFFSAEGEDRLEWNDNVQKEKVDDWTEAGYQMFDFFLLALKLSGFTREKLSGIILTSSQGKTIAEALKEQSYQGK